MRLGEHLNKTGKSLQQASSETGYTVNAFRHWLSGRSIPRRSTMARLREWSDGAVTPADWYSLEEGERAA